MRDLQPKAGIGLSHYSDMYLATPARTALTYHARLAMSVEYLDQIVGVFLAAMVVVLCSTIFIVSEIHRAKREILAVKKESHD